MGNASVGTIAHLDDAWDERSWLLKGLLPHWSLTGVALPAEALNQLQQNAFGPAQEPSSQGPSCCTKSARVALLPMNEI